MANSNADFGIPLLATYDKVTPAEPQFESRSQDLVVRLEHGLPGTAISTPAVVHGPLFSPILPKTR
ncbi:MAG: hypothetical protein V4719_13965 [Planctomycetota bacterium]